MWHFIICPKLKDIQFTVRENDFMTCEGWGNDCFTLMPQKVLILYILLPPQIAFTFVCLTFFLTTLGTRLLQI